jgi:hypothetical protein
MLIKISSMVNSIATLIKARQAAHTPPGINPETGEDRDFGVDRFCPETGEYESPATIRYYKRLKEDPGFERREQEKLKKDDELKKEEKNKDDIRKKEKNKELFNKFLMDAAKDAHVSPLPWAQQSAPRHLLDFDDREKVHLDFYYKDEAEKVLKIMQEKHGIQGKVEQVPYETKWSVIVTLP